MDYVSRLQWKKTIPAAFTICEIQEIRAAIKAWEVAPAGAPRQLGQLIEVTFGTSTRIGEALAIRLQVLGLDAPVPTVWIAGTIITRKGQKTHRPDHPKTDDSVRHVARPAFARPAFALHAIRSRLLRIGETDPDALLFLRSRGVCRRALGRVRFGGGRFPQDSGGVFLNRDLGLLMVIRGHR